MEENLFFKDAQSFRDWLKKNHQTEKVLWVCYYKKHTKLPSITYEESVTEALCYGWIDGIKKSIDELSYKHRFTPRRKNSNWSKRNIETVKKLIKENRMAKAGLVAYSNRNEDNYIDSDELGNPKLPEYYIKLLKTEKQTWKYYNGLTPSVKRLSINWIMSAKKKETRDRRFQIFLESCTLGKPIPQLR